MIQVNAFAAGAPAAQFHPAILHRCGPPRNFGDNNYQDPILLGPPQP